MIILKWILNAGIATSIGLIIWGGVLTSVNTSRPHYLIICGWLAFLTFCFGRISHGRKSKEQKELGR